MLLPISQIKEIDRLREIDQSRIEELKNSIRDNGLLQPIVVVKDEEPNMYRLVAGGHRLECHRRLNIGEIPAIDLVDFLIEQGQIEPGQKLSNNALIKYEIEENVKRISMTWQDRVHAVVRYHKTAERDALASGDKWLQSQTGELLGIDQSYVSRFILLAKRIKSDPNGAIANAASVKEAIKLLLQEKLEDAQKKQVKLLKDKREATQRMASTVGVELGKMQLSEPVRIPKLDEEPAATNIVQFNEIPKQYFYDMYFTGDALDMLEEVAKVKTIHHIVTDPPYGIDMNNLNMKNLESVVATHQVEPNIALLMEFLGRAKRVIHPSGFLCMWYDLDHHEKLMQHAKAVGWKVCRWPFVWAKSSSCMNQAAAYNFTKSTEVCMILRASEEAVLVNKQANNFIVAPSRNSTSHPFHKPLSVWSRLIEAVSYEGQTILDPFAGSGSCLSASLSLGRDPVGVELDEAHIHTGVNWMHKEHNQPDFMDMPVL